MNNRQRLHAILGYENYDRMPVVHFGYWAELLEEWAAQGRLKPEEIAGLNDGDAKDRSLAEKLGFDFNYTTTYHDLSGFYSLLPTFATKRVREHADGSYELLTDGGMIVLQK